MAQAAPKGRKRKATQHDDDSITQNDAQVLLSGNGAGIDMASDDEDDEDFAPNPDSSEEEDEFPEIDANSDSDVEDIIEGDEPDEEDDEKSTDEDEEVNIGPKGRKIISDITGRPKTVYPEIEPNYDSDSSTEDDPNRVGNVPMHWYDDMPHIGYGMDGKKVFRPAKGDELDKFLATVDDPNSWTTAFDKSTQADKPLTSEELDIIRRLQAGENPDAGYDPYEPTVEWFTGKGKEEVMPLSAAPEPKRRWVPSKWEKKKVMKIVRAIRQGRIVPNKPRTADAKSRVYDIWGAPSTDHAPPLAAPKVKLPTNAESYNPPAEYLPTEEEKKAWEEEDKEDRDREYLSRKYNALRLVPAYADFIQERFSRQLDLYLAPRVQRKKINIDPNSLIPQLPSPSSLRPFPSYRANTVPHGSHRVRTVSCSPDGMWTVSADESGLVLLWETLVGRPVKTWRFKSKVGAVEWCPRKDVSYFVVALEEQMHVISPPHLPLALANSTRLLFAPADKVESKTTTPSPIKWRPASDDVLQDDRPLLSIDLPASSGNVKQIAWHRRGDYFATLSATESHTSVWIHQTSKRHSQAPFKKIKGSVQRVSFHPQKPHFFVATQRYVRIYDLAQQALLKTLMPGIRWISSLDIHPSGDHLIVGGYDRKVCWFDLDLSSKPYKVLRYHSRAIRAVQFHPVYPLFASSSDDGTVQIFHSRVFNDLMTDPLIVPLKILRGHNVREGLGVLDVKWNPTQPWLVSAGADGAVSVWCA
ncbi:BOP1NT-domain-containing protein [Auriculariales sp. MPI-PUGE-AT-0066]|nr:BOP1NT-domain-containing protein [Auriculariales sp. MPI-PUGE-AT-0066]